MKKIQNAIATFFRYLSRKYKQFYLKDTIVYKIFITPLIKVSFTVFGGTVGIWGYYILLNILFVKVFPTAIWPGLSSFIEHGEILIISFAFLAESLYYSTRDAKINIFNFISGLLLLCSLFLYARVIALKNSSIHEQVPDSIISNWSPLFFYASIIIFYLIIMREKYLEEFGSVTKKRDNDLDTLENKFNRSLK